MPLKRLATEDFGVRRHISKKRKLASGIVQIYIPEMNTCSWGHPDCYHDYHAHDVKVIQERYDVYYCRACKINCYVKRTSDGQNSLNGAPGASVVGEEHGEEPLPVLRLGASRRVLNSQSDYETSPAIHFDGNYYQDSTVSLLGLDVPLPTSFNAAPSAD